MCPILRTPTLFVLLLATVLSAEDGWKELFNGKDLRGWRATLDDGSFTVESGTIRANTPTKTMSHLYYVGDLQEGFVAFKNFELELFARAEGESNSGIYFHTDTTPRNKRNMLKNGYEVQLNSTLKETRKTGSLYRVVDLEHSAVDESEWFKIRIKVFKKQITVSINGETIVDYTEPENPERVKNHEGKILRDRGGAIALQAHDPESVYYFKDIRIRSLDTETEKVFFE